MLEQQPRKLKRCTIKEEFVSLVGDAVSAAILNQMIFWQEIVNKSDQELQNEIEAYEKIGDQRKVAKLQGQLKNGWFWKSAREMSDEIMFSTRQTVDRKMRSLVDNKFMESRPNPDPRHSTNYYRVNLSYIQDKLGKLGFSLEGYALSVPIDPEPEIEPKTEPKTNDIDSKPSKTTTYGIAQNEQYHIEGVAQNEQGVAQNEQGLPKMSNISSITSLGFQSLALEEEEVYTGNDPVIHMLIKVSNTKLPTIRHEAFLQNLTRYNIPNDMALQIIECMANDNRDINTYHCAAIDRTFTEYAKRSTTADKIKVFPRWFTSTIFNKQFEVDQDFARQDEQRRAEERLQRDLQRWKVYGQQLEARRAAAATSES
ncbi:hypothetical protein [Paenibacillus kribbensis]|uniref:hypothetical protein n=1 Tax=Paenibacillus kribbensis TaxID=172713 RepID=UPI000837E217|nr:hypothetical protein [Paenibacillus kribbensis]